MKIDVDWSEFIVEIGKIDPLGLWKVGDRLIAELLPALSTVVQQRPARYFSMYCWLLDEAGRDLQPDTASVVFWKRFYVLEGISLCAIQSHTHTYQGFGGCIGTDHAQRLITSHDKAGNVNFSSLSKNRIRNGWEVNYKNSMLAFGLIQIDHGVTSGLRLTEAGQALSKVYKQTIRYTQFYTGLRQETSLPLAVIQNLGTKACPCLLHNADTPELSAERDTTRSVMLAKRELPPDAPAAEKNLWQSIHLVLHILSKMPDGIEYGLHAWRRLLSTGLLPNGQTYKPPKEQLVLFRMWQFYALDSLFTYALEMALHGFLEELHAHDDMNASAVNQLFSTCAMKNKKTKIQNVVDAICEFSQAEKAEYESVLLNNLEAVTGASRAVYAFSLYCYCQACFDQLCLPDGCEEAQRFFRNLSTWDGNELALFQATAHIKNTQATMQTFFSETFMSEWVIKRQINIRASRNKEIGWFGYNSETKTFRWESFNKPNLYRADRLPNLMGFLHNMAIVSRQNNTWYLDKSAYGDLPV